MMAKVRVGVIGTSGWTESMFLASLGSHPGAEVVAICGRDGERAGAVAGRHGIGGV
jgi:predicted dehydrogenase